MQFGIVNFTKPLAVFRDEWIKTVWQKRVGVRKGQWRALHLHLHADKAEQYESFSVDN